jgi:hypothetical protein
MLKEKPTFLAEDVMLPGKMIIPLAMFFSSKMLSSLKMMKKRCMRGNRRDRSKCTDFRMVFTPTLFSSEKNTKIWFDGSVRALVKKLS